MCWTAVALSTAGWPDKTIRAIESKQPDRFKASAAPLSRHLKRQEGRSRLDSKPYSVARICAHLPRVTYSKTAYEMPTACTFLQHIYIYIYYILWKHFFQAWRVQMTYCVCQNVQYYLSSFIFPRVVPTSFSFVRETPRCCISFNVLLLKITRQY